MIPVLGNETSANQLYVGLQSMLADVVPDFELKLKAEVAAEINRLKVEKNAVILGHNYMEPALFHSIPDYVGDSLDLARRAATTNKDIIVFCGVRFMAETAKILNPTKTVLLPSEKAGCSLAASITAADVRALKRKFPGVPVVTYVNTYAAVKAESDICCSSSNAAAVVESVDSDTVLFLPDEYLAKNVARETGRHIIFPTKDPRQVVDSELDYQMIGWPGRCEVHEKFTTTDIADIMPLVLINPEVTPVGEPVKGSEGCLSFPEVFAEITRPDVVDVKAMNQDGKTIEFRCGGLLARAVQHETDHLHGILFIDRMTKEAKEQLRPELEAMQAETKERLKG